MAWIDRATDNNLCFAYFLFSIFCAIFFILGCTSPIYSDDTLIGGILIKYETFFPITNIIYYIISVLILGEIIYWLADDKPTKKENIMSFTLKIKSIAILMSVSLFGLPAFLISLYQKFPKEMSETLRNIFWGIIAYGIPVAIFIICIYGWIYLNSYKYRKKRGGKN